MSENTITPRQLEILQHALGVDRFGAGPQYRNRFCAGEKDEPDCRALIAMGLMQEHQRTTLYPYLNCSVTEAGREAVATMSPKSPKQTASQKRYRRFLAADSGLRFGEWLKEVSR